ncbi:uncharacterized protein LOC121740489 isoform X2 [Aricia agestis]|uniref:uncharacterized protein LOC121740489 isoform X2 n=1 Tax=Aricia agestis TaxID=91739 RepID=UPI001C204384|nr:uncharacterized protein LOC121740489 isoform X2 [Aricia agestis]
MLEDYIRARYDEGFEDYPEVEDRVLYFYRTPLPMYPRVLPVLAQEHTKRTENIFKNHMINKDYIVNKSRGKRTSKAGLSQLMLSKHEASPIMDSGHFCPYGK